MHPKQNKIFVLGDEDYSLRAECGNAYEAGIYWLKKEPWNLFIKSCVLTFTCLNFSHLQSTLHWCNTPTNTFYFHWSQQFLNSSILMSFSASVIFCFTSSTSAKTFEDFLNLENQKSSLVWDRVNREGRALGSCLFLFSQKLLNTQCGVDRCTCKSAIIRWANTLTESSKNIHWS